MHSSAIWWTQRLQVLIQTGVQYVDAHVKNAGSLHEKCPQRSQTFSYLSSHRYTSNLSWPTYLVLQCIHKLFHLLRDFHDCFPLAGHCLNPKSCPVSSWVDHSHFLEFTEIVLSNFCFLKLCFVCLLCEWDCAMTEEAEKVILKLVKTWSCPWRGVTKLNAL